MEQSQFRALFKAYLQAATPPGLKFNVAGVRYFNLDGGHFGVSNDQEFDKIFKKKKILKSLEAVYGKEVSQCLQGESNTFIRGGTYKGDNAYLKQMFERDVWNTFCYYKKFSRWIGGYYFTFTNEETFFRFSSDIETRMKIYEELFKIPVDFSENALDGSFPILTEFNKLSLSERELSCIIHYFLRRSTKEIAQRLNISPRSVETYLKRVHEKTGGNKEKLFKTLLKSGAFQEAFITPVQKSCKKS
jgi:DNA-binding CsgD family transcriptional regulator